MPHTHMSIAPPPDAFWRTAVVVASFYLATSYVLRVLVSKTAKLLAPLAVWAMLTCVVPMAVDYVLWWINGARPDEPMLSTVSAFGAVGALIQCWTTQGTETTFGIDLPGGARRRRGGGLPGHPPEVVRKAGGGPGVVRVAIRL